jgi:hypothetical protein
MELRDTTVEANSAPDMTAYYLYRMQSKQDRWGLAVEQLEADRFSVAVTYQEPGWPVHGVARYWVYATRDLAEARFLELQRLLGGEAEDQPLKALTAKLPPEERLDEED